MEDRGLSVYILTYNNEDTIERCLKSVQWADELVVLDHYSTDRTPEICRRYTDRFFQKEWTNYRDEYNHAVDLTSHRWVMFLDSDEEMSPELAEEIREALRSDGGRWAGYLVPRMTYYLGRWIRHGGWYPDYKLRIHDRTRGRWEGRPLDPKVRVQGAVRKLKNVVLHYSFRDLTDHMERMNRYSGLFAEGLLQEGRPFRLWKLVLHPPFRFLRNYFFKRGFMDGTPGLISAVSSAYYVFLKYAKLWELEHRRKNGP